MSSTMDDRQDPARIERDSEEIRADVNATLDALGRKLSPGQLIDRSAAYLRDNGGELAANFGRQVRDNPIPLALTAIGLVWLIAASGRTSRARGTYEYYGTDDYAPDEYATQYTTGDIGAETEGSSTSKLSQTKERVQQGAVHLKESVQHTASAARDKLRASRERMRSSSGRMREGGGRAMARMGSAARGTRNQAVRAKDSFVAMAEEQPLALAAIGVALGAIIGAVLPGSRREDEWLGRARDRTVDRARELGAEQYEELRERAVTAAERAKEAAKDAFKEHGTSGTEQPIPGAPREEGTFRGESSPAGRA